MQIFNVPSVDRCFDRSTDAERHRTTTRLTIAERASAKSAYPAPMGIQEPPNPRKRMKRWDAPGTVRFLTFSCFERLPLFSNPRIADHFVESLGSARDAERFELFAYVVMPEHVHMLMRSSLPLSAPLRRLKTTFAQRVISRWRELDAPILNKLTGADGTVRFWQRGGGFDRNVRDLDELQREIRYIHRNPVVRGLCMTPPDYVWSSASAWAGEPAQLCCDSPPDEGFDWGLWKGFM